MRRRPLLLLPTALASFPPAIRGVAAQGTAPLRVAFDAEWTSLDPHFHSFPYNLSVAHLLFDSLVELDAAQAVVPRLAERWEAAEPTRWVFHLRGDARFAGGAPVTAADVVASIGRIATIRNSPGPLTSVTRPITAAHALDPRTVEFRTREPTPILPALLTAVYVVPARLAEAPTEAFNTGEAQAGSGPYRFVSYRRGERLELARNPDHWGPAPAWDRIDLRILPNTAAREAALLAGDVDFIVNPSTTGLERLSRDPAVAVHRAVSTRITYLQVHQGPQPLADLTGTNGRNPFADPRVRRAASLAIPREALTARVLDGLAVPASQIIPPGQPGHDPSLRVEAAEPEAARRLLAEAGWSGGFNLRLSTPSDRNLNGRRVAEAIAAALTRIGIRTTVNAVPLSVWLAEWRRGQYSMVMHGAGPVPVTWTLVPQMVGTKDMAGGFGPSNESYYSNAGLDRILRTALAEIDNSRRETLLREAASIVRAETAIIPLYHEAALWASRAGLTFAARSDTLTYVDDIRRR
ncbi:ABC transporter substrate-binding protein [Muricoccus radiodurans]|uniref:ABC transporter substrate-binding protein n=1 Tax=Muricoccus radiodurans TaxID=2231721 RepID=UPI003CF7A64C